MKKTNFILTALLLLMGAVISIDGCRKDEPAVDLSASGFPNNVGKIILGQCAVSGCHNTQSKDAAGGLDLSTWDKLFEGGRGGACVIPYRPDYSTCMFYINNDFPEFGISLQPKMPYGKPPLTYDEIKILNDWIKAGAPSRDGKIKFADNPRKKIYITNQGCDEVAVIDAKTKLVMRYVHVGISAAVESPHTVHVSPDGNYWYVSFLNSTVLQKFKTSDDSWVADIPIGAGSWNTFAITSDSRKAFVADWGSAGIIKYVDLQTLATIATYNSQNWAHGTAVDRNITTLYNGSAFATSNYIWKLPISNPLNFQQVTLGISPPSNLYPHDLALSPDGTKYFVTCQGSNELRIMNVANDSLLAAIPTGTFPQEIAFSLSKPYVFVACMEDVTLFPGNGKRGAVTVVNYLTNQFVANIDAGGYQPHGVAVDDENGIVFVASRNIATSGPAPHHSSNCTGRNGFITAFDLNTFQRIPGFRTELSVDPYYISITP